MLQHLDLTTVTDHTLAPVRSDPCPANLCNGLWLSLCVADANMCYWLCTDLWLCVADPTRPGHEESYYPGDTNFKKADIIVINKANNADQVKC